MARIAPQPRDAARWLLLCLLAVPWSGGCSDSPSDVVEEMGEHAQRRRLTHFRRSFSETAQRSLRRQFTEDGVTEATGWRDLMIGYLGREREPPDVLGEEFKGEDRALVQVAKRVKPKRGSKDPVMIVTQSLYMTKQDDEWRVALGPMIYDIKPEESDEEEGDAPPKDEPVEEDYGLGDEQKKDEPLEEINLDDF